MALQTREQHIKREPPRTYAPHRRSLATMASFYAVYHGPEGLKKIARRVHSVASHLNEQLQQMGYKQHNAASSTR